jgi:hypothetical protein
VKAFLRLLAAISVVAALAPMPTASAAVKPAAQNGFSEVAGCISGAENLLVSIVVDESLSLRETDPKALRVEGITTAIDSLEQLGDGAESLNVEVSMSTFARTYRSLVGWRELTPDAAQQLRTRAEQDLPGRDAGNATDYRQALTGAKRDLDARQQQLGDPNACKLLLWFTDGALDVDADTSTATDELCRPGGIADAVRDDGIAVVALALFTPGAGVSEPQREQLRAVAEGRGNGVVCGTVPIPADSAQGVYLPADDPAVLQRLFAGAGALVAGGTEVDSVPCPGTDCREGRYSVNIDPGIAGVRVLVQTPEPQHLVLTTPSGRMLQLTNGSNEKVDGATVSYLARDQLGTINIDFDPYAEHRSSWTVNASGPSQMSSYWFWGARLAATTSQVRAGATTSVTFALRDQRGDPLSPELYRRLDASIKVGGNQIPTRLDATGNLTGKIRLRGDKVPSHLPVTASLSARSNPSGVRLGPVSGFERFEVTLPPAYPTVRPTSLDFGHLAGLGTATTTLELTGSKLGPTQVCVTGSRIALPGAKPQAGLVQPDDKCVDVAAGGKARLKLEMTPDKSVDGVASGDVQLRVTAADGTADLALTVPASLDMERVVDQGMRWLLVALLIALALLLPLLLLIGSNLLLGRFILASTSRIAAKPVRITQSGLESLDGSTLIEPEDFHHAAFTGTQRSSRVPLRRTPVMLRARRIFSLNEPQGVATIPRGGLLVSGFLPYRGKSPTEAPVALSELDAAFVIVDLAGVTAEAATGTLVMVVPVNVDRQGMRDRAMRISSIVDWQKTLTDAAGLSGAGAETARDELHVRAEDAAPQVDIAWGGSEPAAGTTTVDAPPEPDWGSPSSPVAADGAGPKVPRFGRRREKPTSQTPPETRTDDDDDLPPLPDFLK